jgi:threonine dehydrogenase-like Zn-dependent dehydrogenase
LSEYVLLPAETVVGVPETLSNSEVAAMQPLSGCVADIFSAGIEMGDTVVILGQGVMGLNLMQLNRVLGAARTITVDIRDEAISLSRKLGADIVIDGRERSTIEAISEATNGVGADIVFECAGGDTDFGLSGRKTLNQALDIVRDEGKIVQVAVLNPDVDINVESVSSRGIKFLGSRGLCSLKLVEYALDLVQTDRVQLKPLITHVLEGLNKVPDAFEITANKSGYKAMNPAQVIVDSQVGL